MSGRRSRELLRSQESVRYATDLARRNDPVLGRQPDYFRMLYPHMLIEDVSLRIMPIGGRSKRPFRVIISPPNDGVERVVAAGVSRRESTGARGELAVAVCDFVRDCAQTIMAFGEAIHEIVYLVDPQSGGKVGFELVFIQPRTVERKRGRLLQYVPADVAADLRVPRYVVLTAERILVFRLPARFQRIHDRMMESLGGLSTPVLPEFALRQKAEGIPAVPFDMQVHERTQKLALAQATKLLGWNARGLLQNAILEFYWLHRELLFERFLIELRGEILTSLNEGLVVIGREMNFSGEVVVEGLPTLADVDAAQEALALGARPFKEIIEPFLHT